MQTYLNDPHLKIAFLAELTKHEERDQLIKGTYGRMNGAFRGCDECTSAGDGKLDAAGQQSLDAGSTGDHEHFEVNAFFAHVTFLLGNGINNMLKVFSGSDSHIDGVEAKRLCCKEKENGADDAKSATRSSSTLISP